MDPPGGGVSGSPPHVEDGKRPRSPSPRRVWRRPAMPESPCYIQLTGPPKTLLHMPSAATHKKQFMNSDVNALHKFGGNATRRCKQWIYTYSKR
mmetsp:Transcript_4899/g.7782  ORF Transcript_4899/g.7782 Transcript_4899/m.7782 type:complete len:94 (-) Transcript_4899:197-478(-)